jgi:hypothetical protein
MHRTRQEDDSPAAPGGEPVLQGTTQVGDGLAPAAPLEVRDTGVDPAVLSDLALRAAYTVPQFNTEWMAQRVCLPLPVAGEVLEQLRGDHLLEVLGHAGPFGFHYAISQRGRERAARLFEISGYVGPAPVSLEAYTAVMESQAALAPEVTADDVATALSGLVLPEESVLLAGLAVSSRRSLFLHGPPGNGKSSLGNALHGALRGDLWIPYCLGIGENIIRIHDPQCHQPAVDPTARPRAVDPRWVKIRRPLIVAGGETTLASFDLAYSPLLRYYEAPLQLKSNGGILLIDDFGRQRDEPSRLINRWIIPLEHRIDYLTLHTGQKIQVPALLMVVIATNLDPEKVTDPAFLRRLGYRLYLGQPTPERYARIFERYAEGRAAPVAPGVIPWLLDRYRFERRELRSCEPRDLIERVVDICKYRGQPLELNRENLDIAWAGYFGRRPEEPSPDDTRSAASDAT